jgi:HlyD family secretion protein
MRKWLILLTSSAIAAVFAVWARSGDVLEVTYADVTSGVVRREVLTSGTLEPAREVEAGAQVSGTVQTIHVDFNSHVKAGEIIARLDPSVYDAELAQARARWLQAQSDADRMQVLADDLEVKAGRARELGSRDLIPRTEIEGVELARKQANADLTAARAAVAAAAALVKQAELNRERTVIRSPIDGIVVSRNVEVGQTLAVRLESPALFRIADLSRMRLLAEIGEAEVGGVSPGTQVTFEIEALGAQQFEGRVAEVRLAPVLEAVGTSGATSSARPAASTPSPAPSTGNRTATAAAPGSATTTQGQASSSTTVSAAGAQGPSTAAGAVVSYTAIVEVDNRDGRIAPGSTAVVLLPTSRRDQATRIPNGALSFRPTPAMLAITGQRTLRLPQPAADSSAGRPAYVWKYEKGKFTPIEVRTGVSDERWTELMSGSIQPGDRLVVSAANP